MEGLFILEASFYDLFSLEAVGATSVLPLIIFSIVKLHIELALWELMFFSFIFTSKKLL
jgi:hypothetical protein